MKSLHFLVIIGIAGCAMGESPGASGFWVPSTQEDEVEGVATPGSLAWSVDVDDGATHRLAAAGDEAVVLAASRRRVTLSRFAVDGARLWSHELASIFGGGAIELGATRHGRIVVAGSPDDGGHELTVVALSESGTKRWDAEIVGEWGPISVRGAAVHEEGAVAVLSEEFSDGRPVRTLLDVFDRSGVHQARETFTDPLSAVALVADASGFVAVGRNVREGTPRTWVRGYTQRGLLHTARIIYIDLTGVWTVQDDCGEMLHVWIAGMVEGGRSCLMPAIDPTYWAAIEESDVIDPLAATYDGDVLTIDGDAVELASTSGRRTYVPQLGTPRVVVSGPASGDPIFALSRDDATDRAQLLRLSP